MRVLSAVFGLVFGGAFAFGGLQIALETAVPTYQTWESMQSWQPTTATLMTVSGSSNNSEATYQYSISGVDYNNDRVYVSTVKDNIGSYHQDMVKQLNWLKDNLQPVEIWFDPNNPRNSVIDRDMRWGFFAFNVGFCAIFIFIGLAVCYASMKPSKATSRAKKPSLLQVRRQWKQHQAEEDSEISFFNYSQQLFQQQLQQREIKGSPPVHSSSHPWLEKKEWRSHRIRSGAKKGMFIMWGFAIVWNAISSPILFVLEDELKKDNYAALIALLFPLIGVFLIRKAWQSTQEWQRFGIIELEMDPFPGSIGGHVGGSLKIKNFRNSNAQVKVELESVYSYMSGSGDNRSRRESIKWAEGGFAKVVAAINGVEVRFRFDVPDNLPESDIKQSGDYNFWRVKVSSEIEGADLNREYNIPVFRTQHESKHIRHDISAQVEEVREQQAVQSQASVNMGDFSNTALARSVIYKTKGGKEVFYFPMFRNKMLTIFALIFAGGFDFAAFSINGGFSDGGVMGIGLLVFSIPFAIVGLLATIACIYLPLNNLTTTLQNRNITVLRRLFIFPIFYKKIKASDIKIIEVKSTGSTGQGVKQIKHFKLSLKTKTFNTITIAEGIDGEDLANQLKDFIGKRLLI